MQQSKRLFKIEHPDGPLYFASKRKAKFERDNRKGNIVVMRGPDHWRGESFNKASMTPKTSRKRRAYRRIV